MDSHYGYSRSSGPRLLAVAASSARPHLGATMEISVVVLALSLQDALGMAFGVCLILWSIWCLYQWEIKPNKEARKRRAHAHLEEMHRKHWERRGRKKPKARGNSRRSS